MEAKKCARCGNFYLSSENVCKDCVLKDSIDMKEIYKSINKNDIKVESLNNIDYCHIMMDTNLSFENIQRLVSLNESEEEKWTF